MGLFIEKVRTIEVTVESENYPYGRRVKRDIGICKYCGAEVKLIDPMDNDCPGCDAIYNMSGQEVKCHARDVDPLDAGERYDDDY